ncbi:hypothetical protein BC938DRAFT_474352 [Jimgerdemannia flammicorona]|uniref:Uncharacterized protein n=1 Tax=Jimgerdemannia flammicorona TaxID=994334 RepID=A0A433Q2Q2_9FUNG|nr:hypothetical protein BC938DRAFT_474352 [Jimgerdemannia flammicorona]
MLGARSYPRVEGKERRDDCRAGVPISVDEQQYGAGVFGKEITIKVETHIRNYIMLPHKDLKASFVNEIPHVKVGQAAEGGVDVWG